MCVSVQSSLTITIQLIWIYRLCVFLHHINPMADIILSLITVCLYLYQLVFSYVLILCMLLHGCRWYVYAHAYVTLVIDAGIQIYIACMCSHYPESKLLIGIF
jgi:hypothetical protein